MTLKELRLAANLTQEQVAQEMNVDQGAVSKWESGVTKPCRKYHEKLAKLYNTTVDALLTNNQQAPAQN